MIGSVLRVRYEVTQALGETPLFQVFSAKDRVQARDVCLRLLKPPYNQESEFLASLSEAVKATASIQHPGLEKVTDLDTEEDTPFLVGELTKGTQLSEKLRKLGSFSVPVAVSTGIALCEALQALHGSGIVHGDVGAHNIIVPSDGEAKLQLPGIWQAFSSSQTAGAVMLPLMAPYLAPEISKGGMPSPPSDVYSLGVLLYELLSGRYPYNGETAVSIALKHTTDATPNVRMQNPSVPNVLGEIIKKAMSKEPAQRYKNAADLLSDLRILQDALRFGRTLSWPIRADEEVEAPQVAPKMTAARPEPKVKEPKKIKVTDEEPPDVPRWIVSAIAFFAGVAALMVVSWMVFNMRKGKEVKIPNLKGKPVAEASSTLKSLGLNIGSVTEQNTEDVPPQHVISTSPGPEEKAFEGFAVNMVVSAGTRFVEAPDIRGMTVDKARSVLSSVGLDLDDRTQQVTDKNIPAGQIVSQVPERGLKVERHTHIMVKVSSGKEKVDRTTADRVLNQKNIYTLTITLTDIKETVTVKVDMTDARGTKTIHEAKHDPEEEIPLTAEGYGPEVTFRIFYDGDLVKQVVQKADEATDDSGNPE